MSSATLGGGCQLLGLDFSFLLLVFSLALSTEFLSENHGFLHVES